MKRRTAIIAANDVPSIVSDEFLRRAFETAGIVLSPTFDFQRFAWSARQILCACIRDLGEPSGAQQRRSLRNLYEASERAYKSRRDKAFLEVARGLELLDREFPRLRRDLSSHACPLPTPGALRDPSRREQANMLVGGLCVRGCRIENGKVRVEFRFAAGRGRPREHAETLFVNWLRSAFLNAGGEAPRTTRKYSSRHHDERYNSFVALAQRLLDLILGEGGANAIERLNRSHAPRAKRPDRDARKIRAALERSGGSAPRSKLVKLLRGKDRFNRAMESLGSKVESTVHEGTGGRPMQTFQLARGRRRR